MVLNRATQAAPDTTKLLVLIAEERSSFKFHHLRIKNYSAWTVLKSKEFDSPDTLSTIPVMYFALPEAKKRTALAASSSSPGFGKAFRLINLSLISGGIR